MLMVRHVPVHKPNRRKSAQAYWMFLTDLRRLIGSVLSCSTFVAAGSKEFLSVLLTLAEPVEEV